MNAETFWEDFEFDYKLDTEDVFPSSCQILWKFPSRLIADQSAAVAIP